MQARTVGLIVAAALAAGWLIGGAGGGGATSQDPSADRARGPRPLGSGSATVAPYTHKLRERMKDPPATPERGRNPFVYRPRAAARPSTTRSAPAETQAATPEAAPFVPAAPMFRLSGIASNQQDGALVMTAIIIDNGVMVFAKTGDKLSGGHMVVRVDEASVIIADSAGVTQTLRLP